MLHLKNKSTWLILGLTIQGIALFCLVIIVIQTKSKSDLINKTYLGNLMGVYRVLDKLPDILYRGPTPSTPLPQYQLKISRKNMQIIEENIPYEKGELTDEDETWVKADFIADDKKYNVKVRIRGDSTVHWADQKKSWRVKFAKDDLFQGIRQLNLIIPEDRGWTAEPMAQYRVQKFGMIQTPMRFVQVNLNGSSPMVYLEIEHWTKEMLEKQGLSGDSDFYKTSFGAPVFENVAYWEKYETSGVRPLDSLEEMEMLRHLAMPGARHSPGFEDHVSSLFIKEELLAWYTNIMLAGSYHNEGDNLRFYFDTTRGKLRPIPWDIHLFTPSAFLITQINGFLQELFRIPEWYLEGQKTLYAYLEENAEIDIQKTASLRKDVERAVYRDRYKLMSNRLAKQGFNTFQSLIEDNINFLQKELKESSALVNQRVATESERSNNLLMTIDITSLGATPVSLSKVHLPIHLSDSIHNDEISLWRDDGSGIFDAKDSKVPLSIEEEDGDRMKILVDYEHSLVFPSFLFCDKEPRECPMKSQRFFVRSSNAASEFMPADLPMKLTIRNAITEKKSDVKTVIIDERTFERMGEISQSRSTFLERNPSFRSVGKNGVSLSGSHSFDESIIVPNTVKFAILPGTTIRMGSGTSLYSYAPVSIIGTENRPIKILGSTLSPWGVFAVLNATEESIVMWAEFSGGGDGFLNGTFVSGMLAFHNSPVNISDSTFRYANGDDALNIKQVPAALERLTFENNTFDALDIDSAPSGYVRDSVFTVAKNEDNAGGDGLDLSWSSITISNVSITNSVDKCISVGERSDLIIENTLVQGCHIGVAAKDGSIVHINNSKIKDNEIGISAYVKKAFFPSPTIEVTNTIFSNNTEEVQQLNDSLISISR